MMFRTALLSALFANTVGAIPMNDIPATSKAGSKLLTKARLLNNNNNNQNAEEAFWIAGYMLKFESCRSTLNTGNEREGGNDRNDATGGVSVSRIIEFRLCPSGQCSKCANSGLYAVPIEDFVQAYMEVKREDQQAQCEAVRENCYNDDEYYCYQQAGLDFCGEEGDIQRYMECAAAELNGNNNNNGNNNRNNNYYYNNNNGNGNGNGNGNNGNKNGNNRWYNRYQCYNEECNLYVGAKCSEDGKSVHLGAFIDETCSIEAPDGTYEAMNYGVSLPYSSKSIIDAGCQSCIRDDGNNNGNNRNKYYYYYYNNYYNKNGNNQNNMNGENYNGNNNGENQNGNMNNGNNWWYYNQNYEVSELCGQLYEASYKCEENLTAPYYPDSSSCYYIKTILPKLDALAKENQTYTALMYWSFVPVLIGLIGAAVGVKHLYIKRQRSSIKLNDDEVGSGAYVSS